jgi:hypothetical protein
MRLRDLTAARVCYGFRRLHVLLRREDWPVNHKRTYRLYSERVYPSELIPTALKADSPVTSDGLAV